MENQKRVKLKNVRLSYAHLLAPQNFDGKEQYSCSLLLPKTDVAGYTQLKNAITETWKAKFPGKPMKMTHFPIRDGDDKMQEPNPEATGHWVVRTKASLSHPPIVTDRNYQPIVDHSEIYSGCYAMVAVSPYAYEHQTNKGVSFSITHVVKLRDGEPLGATNAPISDVFTAEDLEGLEPVFDFNTEPDFGF